MKTPTVRSRTKKISETIENYDELAAFFAGTAYAHAFPPEQAPTTGCGIVERAPIKA